MTSFFCSAILREEVKYVHTGSDLMIMEKTARGKKDIVLGYVLGLGTPGMLKMGECYGNAMCTETCLATFDDAQIVL